MGSHSSLIHPKLQQRNNQIQQRCRTLKTKLNDLKVNQSLFNQIINLTAHQAADKLNKGQLTSQQVVTCLALQSGNVGVTFKVITEDNFLQAIDIAIKCDQFRKTSGRKNWSWGDQWNMDKFLPPLFGVPISIKDTIDMNGFASTIGLSSRVDRIKADGTIMHCLRNSGLIPFVRTNIPQLAMTMESNNFVWGRAVNPWDPGRAVGGSTGGQGGLIAARGSFLGVGSDLGGSIRIPAQFCGISSLKPGSGRLSFSGHTPYIQSFDGMNTFLPALGPLARSIDDLALWMKIATTKQLYKGKHDPSVKLFQFQDKPYLQAQKSKFKIGYLTSLNMIEASPASQRAVREVVDLLKSKGHQVQQIRIPNQRQLIGAFYKELTGEGEVVSYKIMLEGEENIPEYNKIFALAKLNCCVRGLISCCYKDSRIGFIIDSTVKRETHQYLWNAGLVKRYRKQWFNFLADQKIDFVILPGFGCQSCLNGLSSQISMAAAYTFIFNVLDVPAAMTPITTVKPEEQTYESHYQDIISEELKKNALNSEGLPVGVQVIGLPYQQQKLLGFTKTIEQAFKFNEKYRPKI